MDTMTQYYALCLVRDGSAKSVTVEHRFSLLNDRLVTCIGGDFALTDKGKDRLGRKGR